MIFVNKESLPRKDSLPINSLSPGMMSDHQGSQLDSSMVSINAVIPKSVPMESIEEMSNRTAKIESQRKENIHNINESRKI